MSGTSTVDRREAEDHYNAYLRMRRQPSPTFSALTLIYRDQFGQERWAVNYLKT
jgi:hypothetical protein